MIIMDLDPGEGVPWQAVIAAAEETRQRLTEAGLAAFVKTSGGKGLHVVSPLKPKADWPAVKAFTKGHRRCDGVRRSGPFRLDHHQVEAPRQDPDRLSAQPAWRDGRRGIFDARPAGRGRLGAFELGRTRAEAIGPAYFTVDNMPTRLASLASRSLGRLPSCCGSA